LKFVAKIAKLLSLCVVVAGLREKYTAVKSAGVLIGIWLIERPKVNIAKVKKAKKKIKILKNFAGSALESKTAWLIGVQHQVALGVKYYHPVVTNLMWM
jgi:hypothetical protein